MEKKYFAAEQGECDALALQFFNESIGLHRQGAKFERMKKDAMRARQLIGDKINLKGQYVYFSKSEFDLLADKVVIGDTVLSCKAFELIDPASVEGLYVYVCTAGDYTLPEEELLLQLHADIWGGAFTDAIRLTIKKELEAKSRLSESFGPGFYGMRTDALSALSTLLDFDELGITVRNDSIMIPLKSAAGLYFAVNGFYKNVGAECEACRGNHTSCRLCQVFIEQSGGILSE